MIACLKYVFPASYQGPVPTPSGNNQASATQFPSDIKKYIDTEVREGTMLGLLSQPPFTPWCQTNPLFTRPKNDSPDHPVNMHLSRPPPPHPQHKLRTTSCGLPDKCTFCPLRICVPSHGGEWMFHVFHRCLLGLSLVTSRPWRLASHMLHFRGYFFMWILACLLV